jgi:hypothetical protein
MSGKGPRVLTVVRGPQLGAPQPSRASPARAERPASAGSAASPAVPGASAEAMSIYGVPASAVQHCCGRGCSHCRIFWHGKKQ